MDIKSAAQTIRDTVDMEQILSLYGYKTRHGFMVCPFHGDTDASLKVYRGAGGWHCYGCGRGGSVIDFVMEHEDCDFRTAVRAIDNALRLGLFTGREDPYMLEDQRRVQKWLDDYVAAIYAYCDAVRKRIDVQQRIMIRKMKSARDKDVQDRSAEEWTLLLTWEEDSQYADYQIEKIDEFKEEVAAWRRMTRRVKKA